MWHGTVLTVLQGSLTYDTRSVGILLDASPCGKSATPKRWIILGVVLGVVGLAVIIIAIVVWMQSRRLIRCMSVEEEDITISV